MIRNLRIEKDSAELEVEVPLVDPMGNVKKVEFQYVRKDAAKGKLEKDKSGNCRNWRARSPCR